MRSPKYRSVNTIEESSRERRTALGTIEDGVSLDSSKPPTKTRCFQQPRPIELLLYMFSCALAYPFLYLVTLVARGQSLFCVRLLVGLGCTAVAFVLSFFLQRFMTRFLESAVWSIVIHQGRDMHPNGMTFDDLSKASNPNDPISIYRVLRVRSRIPTTPDGHQLRRKLRFVYPTSLLFLLLFVLSEVLAFTLGRIINITARSTFHYDAYNVVGVYADIAPIDTRRPTYSLPDVPNVDFYGSNDGPSAAEIEMRQHPNRSFLMDDDIMPPTWRYNTPGHALIEFDNEPVYFTAPYSGQLQADGIGIGGHDAWRKANILTAGFDNVRNDTSSSDALPSLLRYPQWGVRTSCKMLPSPEMNIIANTSSTQVHVPNEFIAELHETLNCAFNATKIQADPDKPDILLPENASPAITSTPDQTTTILYDWSSLESGDRPEEKPKSHLVGYITDNGVSGDGWTTFDVMISRTYVYCRPGESDADCLGPIIGLNSSAVLNVSSTYPNGLLIHEVIGCVQRVEPWILEVQNSTRFAVATGVFAKGSSVQDAETQDGQKMSMRSETTHSIPAYFTNNLNSTNKSRAYREMYDRSSATWITNSGPALGGSVQYLSWTDGPGGVFSPTLFEQFRSITTAKTLLNRLAGSVQVLTYQFQGRQAAFAHIQPIPLVVLLGVLCTMGILGCTCVPAIPDGFPERKFDVYSWIASTKGDGLIVEDGSAEDGIGTRRKEIEWRSRMNLEEIKREFGEKQVRYRCLAT